jgi:hypothetical protein
MKKVILAATVLGVALSLSSAQNKNQVRQVEVSARTVASQPATKPYVLDLTRAGTVYSLGPGTDFSRLLVRTDGGEKSIGNLASQFRTDKNILIGTLNDLWRINFGFPTVDDISGPNRVSEAQCKDGVCGCTGKKDCGDLGRSGKCASGTVTCGTWGVGPDKGKRGCQCLVKL